MKKLREARWKKVANTLRCIMWMMRSHLLKPDCLRNIIVFESSPDLSDNTKAVFDEMLRRGINRYEKI